MTQTDYVALVFLKTFVPDSEPPLVVELGALPMRLEGQPEKVKQVPRTVALDYVETWKRFHALERAIADAPTTYKTGRAFWELPTL